MVIKIKKLLNFSLKAEEGEFERLINQLQPTAKVSYSAGIHKGSYRCMQPNIILDACGKIEAKLLENPALKEQVYYQSQTSC